MCCIGLSCYGCKKKKNHNLRYTTVDMRQNFVTDGAMDDAHILTRDRELKYFSDAAVLRSIHRLDGTLYAFYYRIVYLMRGGSC